MLGTFGNDLLIPTNAASTKIVTYSTVPPVLEPGCGIGFEWWATSRARRDHGVPSSRAAEHLLDGGRCHGLALPRTTHMPATITAIVPIPSAEAVPSAPMSVSTLTTLSRLEAGVGGHARRRVGHANDVRAVV